MTLEQLRLKHPRLVYRTYAMMQDEGKITITYEFLLEPDFMFRPTVTIPYSGDFDSNALEPYVFQLGMVEAISYWKAACPAEFVVEAGHLSASQIHFWYDLIMHGLGEFFYKNRIDFTAPDFLKIIANKTYESYMTSGINTERNEKDLVLVGGGKDSAVTLGILTDAGLPLKALLVNPTQAALALTEVAHIPDPIIVERALDPKLFELNASGYLNGHTPFSAFLAFLGVTVAAMYGNERVIVSNEQSASEANVVYRAMEVNHQYSKSFRFEEMFRKYTQAEYFSFLRPLNDMQIGLLFARYPKFFREFRSCNVGSRTNTWCGTCPKCAFTFLILSPVLSNETMMDIFGSDYFTDATILSHIEALVGLKPIKPFECVGTRDEAKLAVILSVEKRLRERGVVPEGLLRIKSDMNLKAEDVARLHQDVMRQWGDTYNLPPDYLAILREAWQRDNK